MVRQKPWDKYEAAVLLEAYIMVLKGIQNRKNAISEVSKKLRKMAENQGEVIDGVFRNNAGITFQMQSMESAYLGYTVAKPATKLFSDVVKLRRENKEEYDKILQEANELTGISLEEKFNSPTNIENRKVKFREWMLDGGMAEATTRSYVSSVALCGKVAYDHGIIDKDIFRIDDLDTLKYTFTALLNNEEFLQKNETRHNQFRAAFAKYVQFSGDISFVAPAVIETTTEKTVALNGCDEEVKRESPELYLRLKSMSRVYDDLYGFSLEHISKMLGMTVEKAVLRNALDKLSWIIQVDEDVYSFSKYAKPYEKPIEFDREAFIRVLMMRYQNGMRFDSIDFDIFRETYADCFGVKINLSDEDLEKCLRKCGVLYKNRIFPAEGIINEAVKEKIVSYIEDSFAEGKTVIYYKAIFTDLSDLFASCYNLTEPLMLKPYLEYVCTTENYFFHDEYLSKNKNVSIDHSTEIEDFLLSVGKPVSYEEIYSGLSHIDQDIVYHEIKTNENIILNEREHYFHYGIFEFSSEDADKITDYISKRIEEEGYCIWSKIYNVIKREMPLFIEHNIYLSGLGIRNAVAKKLNGRFTFDGEVICRRDQTLNMSDVYRLFAKHNAPFSDDDIYDFSKEINGGVIYFDSLAEETVRVSRKLFVAADKIEFDVDATDEALATYLTTGYMLIKDVDSFLVFPNVGYEWNVFLLESYLMYYSKKYALCNNGKSLNNVAGALIRKGTGYDGFEEVCADVLARSGIALTKNSALNFLAEQNLLTRRSYKGIEKAITKAGQIRNRKE